MILKVHVAIHVLCTWDEIARKQGDSRSRIILIYFRATKMRSRHLAVK